MGSNCALDKKALQYSATNLDFEMVDQLISGCTFSEGPVNVNDEYLLYSDGGSHILKYIFRYLIFPGIVDYNF